MAKKPKILGVKSTFLLTQRTHKATYGKPLSDAMKDRLYENLKKRVKLKSETKYVSGKDKLVKLCLERQGSHSQLQYQVIVVVNTFQLLYDENGAEIGFECLVYPYPGKVERLWADRRNYIVVTQMSKYFTGEVPKSLQQKVKKRA